MTVAQSGVAAAVHAGDRSFFALLLAATALPLLLFPAATRLLPDLALLDRTNALLVFVGSSGHVAASFFFYSERHMRRHMLRTYPGRFVLAPVLLLLGMGAFGALLGGHASSAYVILFYWIWQTHHYNRQNHGILAFVSRAEGQPVRERDRIAVTLAGAAAVLGMVTLVTPFQATVLAAFGWQLETMALVVFGCAWACYLPSMLRDDPRSTPMRCVALLALMLFYLPLFLFDDAFTAVMTYAIAHGLQYHVFMFFVARTPGETRTRALASLLLWGLVGGAVLHLATTRPQLFGGYGTTVYAMGLGVVMWHFVLDAGVWRLSERFQRTYMAERFRFL